MIETWIAIMPDLFLIIGVWGPHILTGLALVLLVLNRNTDTQEKILWVLVIALIPVIGPLVSLIVRPWLARR